MNYYQVGKIVNTQGLKGELRVISTSDFTEERFKVGNKIYLFEVGDNEPLEMTIRTYRKNKKFVIISFVGYDDINTVEQFKQADLKVSKEQLGKLDKGQYYHHQIIGLNVKTIEGKQIGKIVEILTPGSNDVWVVKHNNQEVLLPAITDVVKKIDLDKKEILIDLLDGLIDEN